jgi:sec-independent protein translocase protein TatC
MSETDEKAGAGANENAEESGKMSFLDHLDELRKRLVRIAIYLAVGFAAGFYFSADLYNFLSDSIVQEIKRVDGTLSYTNPTGAFVMSMKVSMLASVFLTLPFTLFEVWKFISPGLYRREKKYVIPFIVSSVLLFLSGAAFCYKIVLPNAFRFLIDWGEKFDNVTPIIKIDEYLDLVTTMLLGFGLVFEMPVVVAFLSIFGLVSASFLWKKLNYALVGIVVLAAVLSPTGDAFNLLLWSAPMVALYIISIGIAAIIGARRKKKGLV